MNAEAYTKSPTVELILSEIKNIKDDLLEQKEEQRSCGVCNKSTEVIFRIEDLDRRVNNNRLEWEKSRDELDSKLEKFTQLVISTLVVAILNLIGIITIYISTNKP